MDTFHLFGYPGVVRGYASLDVESPNGHRLLIPMTTVSTVVAWDPTRPLHEGDSTKVPLKATFHLNMDEALDYIHATEIHCVPTAPNYVGDAVKHLEQAAAALKKVG